MKLIEPLNDADFLDVFETRVKKCQEIINSSKSVNKKDLFVDIIKKQKIRKEVINHLKKGKV
jgi:hypothetical protein